MPVARSVSASHLARGDLALTSVPGSPDGDGPALLQQKAHTLDRFQTPSSMNMNGINESRRKRAFMSFRLSKKTGKSRDGTAPSTKNNNEINANPNGVADPHNIICENGNENLDGGVSDSSSNASVKPKKKYLTRMSSFVNKVASKVQGSGPYPAGGGGGAGNGRGKLERSKTISMSDLRTGVTTKLEDYVEFCDGKVPGMMGIRNHGNTCFINAVIQCLNHTDVLAEYFVLDQYKLDLARCNKINSKKYGTRGEITEQFAVLLKALWTLKYVSDVSMNFKNTVDKYESLYRGSQQHDAAEFLMFVLDKVHEDLNTASKRKYKKIKNTYGRPDDVVAAETLANHLRCNSSFVHDIFQAQFRSSLKCPHCKKESNTFDPFLCVSIPIPQREVLALFITVVYLNQQPKQVQLGVSIEANASVRLLRQQLSEDCGISANSLVVTEVDGEGFHRTFSDSSSVNVINPSDPVYAIEMQTQKPRSQENGEFILLTWVNVVLAEPDNIRFGGVYQSQVVRDVSYVDLQKLLLKEMNNMVTGYTLVTQQESGLFLIGVDDGGSLVIGLDPALDVPLFHESVEQALALCEADAGPPHVKLILQWTHETKEKYIVDDVDHIDVHSSVKELKENPDQCASVELKECLQLHTSAEKLGCGDAWHCPTCNRKQQVVKRLMLWSAPQILVLHLKRFRQGTLATNSSKLSTTVKFPLKGFDISDHIANRPNNINQSASVDVGVLGSVWSPWKKPKPRSRPVREDNVYDLYAVCNHHGQDMQGGHYTAICYNTADGKWYQYDDSKVEEVTEDEVVAQDAYILFYQRRESDKESVSSSDSEPGNHWAYKIPISTLPPALVTKDKDLAPAPFERGRSYGTLPVSVRSSREDSEERDHVSDSEAPLATHEESPVAKRKSQLSLNKSKNASEETLNGDSLNSNLKVETIMVEVEKDDNLETQTNSPMSSDSERDSPELSSSVGSTKTVLISRCQAMDEQEKMETSKIISTTNHTENGYVSEEELLKNTTLVGERRSMVECTLSDDRREETHIRPIIERAASEEVTPEVRIHPATPEVLAAHHAQTQVPKKSVITLTLRPRNPSESSDTSTDSKGRVITRTNSVVSCCSTISNTSRRSTTSITANGVEHTYQNGTSFEESSDFNSSPETPEATPDIRIMPLPKAASDRNTTITPVNRSPRSTNTNKTPSFVVVNTPTASPRPVRPKSVSICNGSSPRLPGSNIHQSNGYKSTININSARPVSCKGQVNGHSNGSNRSSLPSKPYTNGYDVSPVPVKRSSLNGYEGTGTGRSSMNGYEGTGTGRSSMNGYEGTGTGRSSMNGYEGTGTGRSSMNGYEGSGTGRSSMNGYEGTGTGKSTMNGYEGTGTGRSSMNGYEGTGTGRQLPAIPKYAIKPREPFVDIYKSQGVTGYKKDSSIRPLITNGSNKDHCTSHYANHSSKLLSSYDDYPESNGYRIEDSPVSSGPHKVVISPPGLSSASSSVPPMVMTESSV